MIISFILYLHVIFITFGCFGVSLGFPLARLDLCRLMINIDGFKVILKIIQSNCIDLQWIGGAGGLHVLLKALWEISINSVKRIIRLQKYSY